MDIQRIILALEERKGRLEQAIAALQAGDRGGRSGRRGAGRAARRRVRATRSIAVRKRSAGPRGAGGGPPYRRARVVRDEIRISRSL